MDLLGGGTKIPDLFYQMLTGRASDFVEDNDLFVLQAQTAAVLKAAVFTNGVDESAVFGADERAQFHHRLLVPTKGSSGFGLVEAVDGDGVVGGGAAKTIALSGVGHVGEGARILEYLFAAIPDHHAETIGMAAVSYTHLDIRVDFHGQDNKFRLCYRDSGVGLPATVNLKNPATLGLQLVSDLALQLQGNLEYEYRHGAQFTLTFG